jgi:uncharacterized membrane protein
MNNFTYLNVFYDRIKAGLFFFTGVIVIPAAIGFYYQISLWHMLGLVASVLILQPLAVVVGLGLGIHPIPMLLIMISIGLAVIFGLFKTCDMFAERSIWLRRHLLTIETITQKSAMFQKYGIYTLIPFIWVPGVGLYGCVLIAWLFKWRGVTGVAVLLAGWCLAVLLVLLASLGVLNFIG